MMDIRDVLELGNDDVNKIPENCICEDCGETQRLQFGICCVCGGNVIDVEEQEG